VQIHVNYPNDAYHEFILLIHQYKNFMTLISPKNFTRINENSCLNKLVGFLDIYDVI
jgi:hypothetical protein